jgi:restriction endonuclease Mrr
MGVKRLSVVRRPGAHGSELHLAGEATIGALTVPTAIMIRRDGKDLGRERVTELRGALHHYGPATQGWAFSTGQVLSGAREEAQTRGASPVALTGRTELAELCVAYGVGVRTHRIEIPLIDLELLEGLQGR